MSTYWPVRKTFNNNDDDDDDDDDDDGDECDSCVS